MPTPPTTASLTPDLTTALAAWGRYGLWDRAHRAALAWLPCEVEDLCETWDELQTERLMVERRHREQREVVARLLGGARA
jgi:hypothetical protein